MNVFARTVIGLVASVAVLAAAAVAPTETAAATTTAFAADAAMQHSILAGINRERAAGGLRPLVASPGLRRAARAHAVAMATRGFFSHESADGTSFDRRVKRFYGPAGARRWAVGENILWQAQSAPASNVLAMWMASAPHRANILGRDFTAVGVSAVRVFGAPGVFGGLDVTIVVTDFGTRS